MLFKIFALPSVGFTSVDLIFRNGNASLPIDRYDVRGLLSELSQHEAKNVEPNLSMEDYLSSEDILVRGLLKNYVATFEFFRPPP